MKNVIEVSLRPYPGTLFVTADREIFETSHRNIYGEELKLEKDDDGRCVREKSSEGKQVYLVYACSPAGMLHELVHVMTHIFERIDIPMNDASTETMAYFLDGLFKDAVYVFDIK